MSFETRFFGKTWVFFYVTMYNPGTYGFPMDPYRIILIIWDFYLNILGGSDIVLLVYWSLHSLAPTVVCRVCVYVDSGVTSLWKYFGSLPCTLGSHIILRFTEQFTIPTSCVEIWMLSSPHDMGPRLEPESF